MLFDKTANKKRKKEKIKKETERFLNLRTYNGGLYYFRTFCSFFFFDFVLARWKPWDGDILFGAVINIECEACATWRRFAGLQRAKLISRPTPSHPRSSCCLPRLLSPLVCRAAQLFNEFRRRESEAAVYTKENKTKINRVKKLNKRKSESVIPWAVDAF